MPTSLKQGNQPIGDDGAPRQEAGLPPSGVAHPVGGEPGTGQGYEQLDTSATPTIGQRTTESPAQKPTGRTLGNRPIRTKVAFILVVPVVALLLFAGLRINDSRVAAEKAEDLNNLGKLSARVSTLTQELQVERGRIVPILANKLPADAVALPEQIAKTDKAIDKFRQSTGSLSLKGDAESLRPKIDDVLDEISNLSPLREGVKAHQLPTGEASFRYTAIITDLLGLVDGVAELAASNEKIADHVRALAAFGHYEEYVSQEGSVLYEALLAGKFAPGQYREFVGTLNSQEVYLAQFNQVANADDRKLLEQKLSRANVATILELENIAIRAETADRISISPKQWLDAVIARGLLVAELKLEYAEHVGEATAQARDDAIQSALVEAAAVLLALVIAIAVSLLIARSMVRPLAQLRTAALDVAYQRLPEVVRQLRDTDVSADSRIDIDTEARAVVTVKVTSTDEIGQVAQAFNAVHLEAVRVATDQARLRQNVSAMFVNLARRSQLLVERLIRLIDHLEQGERDADRLSELFKLDHLATRMRRNDENLMVLAGADAGRRWSQDAALIDVLRAAISEVEQYTRIKVGHVDQVDIGANAVSDVVHLVAELLENAASFSSPRTEVLVDARLVGGQVVIEIEDQGIGMSADQLDELNDRLSRPPTIDVSVSRMMGLFVVGRLANRHGVRVMLRSSVGGGVLAIVALPNDTLINVAPLVPELPPTPGDSVPTQQNSLLPTRPVPPPAGSEAADAGQAIPPQRASTDSGGSKKAGEQGASPATPATPAPSQWRYQANDSDSTLEMPLPIFEQIESEWFRPPTRPTATPTQAERAEPETTADSAEAKPAKSEQQPTAELPSSAQIRNLMQPDELPRRSGAEAANLPPRPTERGEAAVPSSGQKASSNPSTETLYDVGPSAPEPNLSWSSPADSGWQLAEELSQPATGDTTRSGLPKRVPMANYVPGAVDQPPKQTERAGSHRSPDAVRGVLSSYRKGLEQGRLAGSQAAQDPEMPTEKLQKKPHNRQETVEEK